MRTPAHESGRLPGAIYLVLTMLNNNNTAVTATSVDQSRPKSRLVALAQSRGSRATTRGGAKRFLLENLPEPLPGLVRLRTPARWGTVPAGRSLAQHCDPHVARARALARRLSADSPGYPAWGQFAARAGHPLTADVIEWLDELTLEAWRNAALNELLHRWPYRRSSSGWAGGDHYIRLDIGDVPGARGWSDKVWSRNGQWSGTDSHARLTVTTRCLRAMAGRIVVGDLITLDCESVGPREFRATWAEQSRGFDLKLVEGWIIRGQHVKASSLASARKKARRERNAQASNLWAERTRVAGLEQDLSRIQVTRADSLAAGNCKAGTQNFIRSRLGFLKNADSIRADHLLAIEDSKFTRRAIAAARRKMAMLASSPLNGLTESTEEQEAEVLA